MIRRPSASTSSAGQLRGGEVRRDGPSARSRPARLKMQAPLPTFDLEHPDSVAELGSRTIRTGSSRSASLEITTATSKACRGTRRRRRCDARFTSEPFSSGTHTSAMRGPVTGASTSHCHLACSTNSPEWMPKARQRLASASRDTCLAWRTLPGAVREMDRARAVKKLAQVRMSLRGNAASQKRTRSSHLWSCEAAPPEGGVVEVEAVDVDPASAGAVAPRQPPG